MLDKKRKVRFESRCHFFAAEWSGNYAIKTPLFEFEKRRGECRQRQASFLWFSGSYSSIVVLKTPLRDKTIIVISFQCPKMIALRPATESDDVF